MGHSLVGWQGVPGGWRAYLPSSSPYNNAECFSFLLVSSPGPPVDTKDLFDVSSHICPLFWGQMSVLGLSRYFLVSRPQLLGPTRLQIQGKHPLCMQVSFLTGGLAFSRTLCPAMSAGDFTVAFENIGSLAPYLIRHQIPGIQSQQDPSNPFPSLFLVSQIHLFHIIVLTQDVKTVSTRYRRMGGLHNWNVLSPQISSLELPGQSASMGDLAFQLHCVP